MRHLFDLLLLERYHLLPHGGSRGPKMLLVKSVFLFILFFLSSSHLFNIILRDLSFHRICPQKQIHDGNGWNDRCDS